METVIKRELQPGQERSQKEKSADPAQHLFLISEHESPEMIKMKWLVASFGGRVQLQGSSVQWPVSCFHQTERSG